MPPARSVEVLGHRIHYYDKGEGRALLLVHGFSGSAEREWGRVFDLLATNHRVIALHQIGFAPSQQPAITYDMPTFVSYLGAFIRTLDLQRIVLRG